jgi:PiT family inorganic phosphate transporter
MYPITTIAAALGLAFVFGVSDAPNAASALVASRAARWHSALAFSFVLHAMGALIGGTAVAATMTTLIAMPRVEVPAAYAAGSAAAIAFVIGTARLGIPSSATYGLVGGLMGAALSSGGLSNIGWGGISGGRPTGVFGTFAALLISPVVGVAAGATGRRIVGRATRRGSRELLSPVKAAIWAAAGLVALSDGTNDGQKAMGVTVAALMASGRISYFHVPSWLRISVALTLALGTVVGGGRVVRQVSRGYYRPRPLDALASQTSAACLILVAGVLGAPVSTSAVVASTVVGVGVDQRPRHVRWKAVSHTVLAWFITVPACMAVGAAFFLCIRFVS